MQLETFPREPLRLHLPLAPQLLLARLRGCRKPFLKLKLDQTAQEETEEVWTSMPWQPFEESVLS